MFTRVAWKWCPWVGGGERFPTTVLSSQLAGRGWPGCWLLKTTLFLCAPLLGLLIWKEAHEGFAVKIRSHYATHCILPSLNKELLDLLGCGRNQNRHLLLWWCCIEAGYGVCETWWSNVFGSAALFVSLTMVEQQLIRNTVVVSSTGENISVSL